MRRPGRPRGELPRPGTQPRDTWGIGYDLEHNGLIQVPLPGRKPGIYWLRFYRGPSDSVAVLTEVPGNPSLWINNAISRVSEFVANMHSVDLRHLVVFQIWPAHENYPARVNRVRFTNDGREKTPGWRADRDPARVETAPFTGRPEWWDAVRDDIEVVIGQTLGELPPHDQLYAQVRELGGGTTAEVVRRVFAPVLVTELPPPHNPSSCAHYERFQEIEAELERRRSPHSERDAGSEFIATLTPVDRTACPFHQARWAEIANESVRILREVGVADLSEYQDEAALSELRDKDRGWLTRLFRDPIDIAGGSYTNGQHRGCALRFSGALRAAVVVDEEVLDVVSDDWTYLGGG